MSGLDLESIRQALTVAEHHSFRRAADVLGIRQSAVSRRVKQLEIALGVPLFDRHASGVRLTPAGATFFASSQRVIRELDSAAARAAAAGTGESGHLTIGFLILPPMGPLRDLLSDYIASHPKVVVSVVEDGRAPLMTALRSHLVDVAFVSENGAIDGLAHEPAGRERIIVALPSRHKLANSKSLRWADVASETFLTSSLEPGPEIQRDLIGKMSKFGAAPRINVQNVGCANLPVLVGAGLGVALMCEAAQGAAFANVAYRPFTEKDNDLCLNIIAYFDPSNANPALGRFLDLLRKRFGSRP